MRFALLTRMPIERTLIWQKMLSAALDGAPVLLGPPHGDPTPAEKAEVEVLFVAEPIAGEFGSWPRVQLIQCLWAGVDGLLRDPSLPLDVPLARMVDPAFAAIMAEAVAAHVLAIHRQFHRYRAQAARAMWQPLPQPHAADRHVGILGLGEMGQRSARTLIELGFQVAGWSRSGRPVPGVVARRGEDGLATLLGQSEILVNLLPLTAETAGILNSRHLSMLPKGASIINLARGGHVDTADLLAALDAGHLEHAILDVFEQEPLPAESPLWRHPSVTVMPHVAAVTDPRSAARIAAGNALAFLSSGEPDGLVLRDRGY